MAQTIITFLIVAWAAYYFYKNMIHPFFSRQNKSVCCDCALSPENRAATIANNQRKHHADEPVRKEIQKNVISPDFDPEHPRIIK